MSNSLLNLKNSDTALMEKIKENEGFVLQPYRLSYTDRQGNTIQEDFFTGGYGTRLTDEEYSFIESRVSMGNTSSIGGTEQVKALYDEKFMKSFIKAKEDAQVYMKSYGIEGSPKEIKDVIVEMAYNMGAGSLKNKSGLMSFKGFASAIREGDYERAAQELKFVDPNVPEKGETAYYNQIGPKKGQKEEDSRVGKLIESIRNVSKFNSTSDNIVVEKLPITKSEIFARRAGVIKN